MSTSRKRFTDYVSVTKVSSRRSGSGRELETFQSGPLWTPTGARGVFGGQVIAQAVAAASQTVKPPYGLHSQHCYFLLPADASIPIQYEVERLRDGRAYCNRLVKAVQRDKAVFILAASYTLPPVDMPDFGDKSGGPIPFAWDPTKEALSLSLRFALGNASEQGKPPGAGGSSTAAGGSGQADDVVPYSGFRPRFAIPFPEHVLPWDECEDESARWIKFMSSHVDNHDEKARKAIEDYVKERDASPVAIAVAKLSSSDGKNPAVSSKRLLWLKARLQPGETPDVETVKGMIAYMSDFQFIGTASRSAGLTRVSTPRLSMLASLDHSTHFYPFPPDFDPSAPILHAMEAAITDVASGRGTVRGLIYTDKGVLIATTLQEGVVRADLGGKRKEKGLVEGRGVGEEDEARGPKAKL